MNTQSTRVTLVQAATLAGVSTRTILRWRKAGLITVEYPPQLPTGATAPATYDPEEVRGAPECWKGYLAERIQVSPE